MHAAFSARPSGPSALRTNGYCTVITARCTRLAALAPPVSPFITVLNTPGAETIDSDYVRDRPSHVTDNPPPARPDPARPGPLPFSEPGFKVWKERQTALEEAASGKTPAEDFHEGAGGGTSGVAAMAAAAAAAAARSHSGKDTDNKDEAEKEKV